MLQTILIDDEPAALTALEKKLELFCDGINIVASCNSAKDGLQAIGKHKPDLVFLDIEMPWMNGFELLECLGDLIDFKIVFVTAYDQYAIQAFKVKAVDYLLKPVDKDDLIVCVDRIKSQIKLFNQTALEELLVEINKPQFSKRLMINSIEGIEILNMDEIIYCQAASNYTYIFTQDSRKLIVSKTLSEIEKSLDTTFMRVHKSYTANLHFIQRYSNTDGGEIVFKTGQTLPVSRRKKEEVLEAIAKLE